MGKSSKVLVFLNILTFVLSITLIYIGSKGVRNSKDSSTGCDNMLMIPVLLFGIFIMFISILGVIGACGQFPKILFVYMIIMLIVLISYGLFNFISIIILWNNGKDKITSSGDYKLSSHNRLLQNKVKDQKNWNKIKICLQNDVCTPLSKKGKMPMNELVKVKEEFLPIVIGCCTPSLECGFTYESTTVWKKNNSTSGSASSNPDCKAWDNDTKIMCFNCERCKAGVLMTMEIAFVETRLVRGLLLVVLILLYGVGSCSYRRSKKEA